MTPRTTAEWLASKQQPKTPMLVRVSSDTHEWLEWHANRVSRTVTDVVEHVLFDLPPVPVGHWIREKAKARARDGT